MLQKGLDLSEGMFSGRDACGSMESFEANFGLPARLAKMENLLINDLSSEKKVCLPGCLNYSVCWILKYALQRPFSIFKLSSYGNIFRK